jgi:hypothetical protein
MRHLAILALLLSLPVLVRSADVEHPTTTSASAQGDHASGGHDDAHPHPRVPEHPTWAKNMTAIIGLMFLAAFLIGPIVRAAMPQEVEPPHAHDEHGGGAHDDPHGHGHDAHGHGHGAHH